MNRQQPSRQQLRQQMRTKRKQLSAKEQALAATRLQKNLSRYHSLLRAKRVALYLANDGEIDPHALVESLLLAGKECYLPVLSKIQEGRLDFHRYQPGDPLEPNRFGIPEPLKHTAKINPRFLDCVLLPLVAFDAQGGRLGMGGGFYDRTFAFKQNPAFVARPKLIGLAHDLQRVESLELASWDIPLSAIATDKRIYQAK